MSEDDELLQKLPEKIFIPLECLDIDLDLMDGYEHKVTRGVEVEELPNQWYLSVVIELEYVARSYFFEREDFVFLEYDSGLKEKK